MLKFSREREEIRLRGWIESEEEIEEIATKYFQDLFKSSNPSRRDMEEVTDCISYRISKQQRMELDQPYSQVEIEAAMKSLSPIKAPVIDDTYASFFQNYWEVVGEKTLQICAFNSLIMEPILRSSTEQ